LTSVRFADQASRATLADYLHAHDVLIARRGQVEAELSKLALSAPCADTLARLRCLRGIDALTALELCAEIGEWERFDHPDQLAAYLGIVPCEHTTGTERRLGSITTAGSTHARRLLVEASWHCHRRPAIGRALEHRERGHTPEIINILLESATSTQRPLAPTHRRPSQTRRNRRGRDRPRARRLLLGDRHGGPLIPTSLRRRPCRRATPSSTPLAPSRRQPPTGGSPTHADTLQFTHLSRRLARRPEAGRLAHGNSAIRRLSNRPTGYGRARQ
jgi:hypothetical protein